MSEFDLETLDIASPEHYEKHGYPHPEWTYLRKHAPVFWYARDNVDPFWAITKHADIVEIGKQPDKFLNAPRLAVFTKELRSRPRRTPSGTCSTWIRPITARYRNVSASSSRRARCARSRRTSSASRARCSTRRATSERCDFVQDVSAKITIAVIAEMLGVPRGDWKLLFKLDQRDDRARRIPSSSAAARAKETLERCAHGAVPVLPRDGDQAPRAARRTTS